MQNQEIIKILSLIVDGLEILGENPFRIKNYENALRKLENTTQNIYELHQKGQLESVGLGKSITDQLKAWFEIGKWDTLEEVRSQIPESVLDMLNIKGLGAKKIAFIWKELHILTTEDLLAACQQNKLVTVKGFGQKTQQNIIESIEFLQKQKGRIRYNQALSYQNTILEKVRTYPLVQKIEPTKNLRRKVEIIDELSFIVATDTPEKVHQWLKDTFSQGYDTFFSTPTYWKGSYEQIKTEFFLVNPKEFVKKQFILTGSQRHVLHFWDLLLNKEFESEEIIYIQAGLPFIPPELREEIHDLQNNTLWKDITNLIEPEHIKGTIHNHSVYSDGLNTIQEMAETAQKIWKWEYLVLCDHSKSSAFYANGMYENKVKEQWKEIDMLNAQNPDFYIFKGIECDILPDGSLDYEDSFRQGFEVVVASVHQNLKMDINKATERLLKAIMHPHTNILGHLTGRLLLNREGYPVDYEAVIDACAKYNVAIELNANPYRLDIDWRWIPYCIKKGVLISINPDAHSIKGYEDTIFGVYAGRKGMLLRENTLNVFSLEEFRKWLSVQHAKNLT
jgi:DNA polymerase (family 10)